MKIKIQNQIFVLLILSFGFNSMADQGYQSSESRSAGPSIKSQVAKILLSSLGGAVLGMSTLSFYDRPQDHLSNVAIGGTIGALLGSVYVTQESLDYESTATLENGGSFGLIAAAKIEQTRLLWGFSF